MIHRYGIHYSYWKDGIVGGSCLSDYSTESAHTAEDAITQFNMRILNLCRIESIRPEPEPNLCESCGAPNRG